MEKIWLDLVMKRSYAEVFSQPSTQQVNMDLPNPQNPPSKLLRPPDFNILQHRQQIFSTIKDCTIWAGTPPLSKAFRLSKAIISFKSPALHQMFSETPRKKIFHLPDVTSAAFNVLLNFIYQLETDISTHLTSVPTALDLLYAVRRLYLEDLEDPIVDFLVVNLDVDSMFAVLQFTDLVDIPRLQKACLHLFSAEPEACLENDQFLLLPLPKVLLLFKQERFCKEIEMLKALERYAVINGLQRTTTQTPQLDEILREIHFLLIPPADFNVEFANSKLLNQMELRMVMAPEIVQPVSNIMTEAEKEFSRFVAGQFRMMRETFAKVGDRQINCYCGNTHALKTLIWDHKCEYPDKLGAINEVLQTAKLPRDLAIIAKTEISAVQRAFGRFIKDHAHPDLFNLGLWEQYLVPLKTHNVKNCK